MLKQHSRFFKSLVLVNDLGFVSLAWWLAYAIRFHTALFPPPEPYVFKHYAVAWLLALAVWGVVFGFLDLYRPRRVSSRWWETGEIFKACFLALLVFLSAIFLLRGPVLSRIVVVLFAILSALFVNLGHVFFREGLRFLRRRGYNLRHVVVIGSGAQAKRWIRTLEWHRHLGLRIAGMHLTGSGEENGGVADVPVIETETELIDLVRSGKVDQVFVTLPLADAARLVEIQDWIGDAPVAVYFVPDLAGISALCGQVEEFNGQPIIALQDSSIHGWNSLLKRILDLSIGGLALAFFSPLMLLIATAIKLTSSGPVFYRQERVGLDGKVFQMLKFRTMVEKAEESPGPAWTEPGDPRVTRVGRWLRRSSLDELGQLINVLRGEMSLVGPRPERPGLIEIFRKNVPNYMLRHHVKAGMTGWAQVNGWRGNTSLEARIEHDIYYIENWSLWLDLKILCFTVIRGFAHKNAY